MSKKVDKFVNGIFNLQTRRFGTLAEIIIRRKYKLEKSKSNDYDALDGNNKIEIKFARVIAKRRNKITEANVIDEVSGETSILDRAIPSTDTISSYDANIEQIKPSFFDQLYYGLFYKDCVKIYSLKPNQLSKVEYSNKQHPSNGNQIEEGQFHIKNTNIKNHNQFFLCSMTYEEIFKLLSANKKKASK
jgi:hypothetical protein